MIRSRYFLLIILVLVTTKAVSLPSDRNQPLNIQADTAERDEISGTNTYSGAVVMERGSMKITADQVVIHSKQDKITKFIAIGQPARYRQTPRQDQEPVIAAASRIEYQVSKEMLYLITNAALEQGGTSLSGNRIEYDVKQSIVKAGSNGKGGDNKRVKMVIPPKSFTDEEDQ